MLAKLCLSRDDNHINYITLKIQPGAETEMFYPALQFLLWRHSGADVERMLELCVATTLVLSCVQSLSQPKILLAHNNNHPPTAALNVGR